jgi:hypothetical protein
LASLYCQTRLLSTRETGRDGPREARRRISSPPWQQVGDRGMLGCLRRRQARKKPKRLRALRFRVAGPRVHLGLVRAKAGAGRSEANPSLVVHGWRVAHGACVGHPCLHLRWSAWHGAQTPGDPRLRKGPLVYGGRGGDLVDVLVRHFLVAEVDRRLGPQKPFSRTQLLTRVKPGEGGGGAVNGGLAFG